MLLTLCQPLNFPRMHVVSWLGVAASVMGRCMARRENVPTLFLQQTTVPGRFVA